MSESVCVVKNVPPKANDEILTKLFSTYGSIKCMHVNRDANTAEITFTNKDEALKACDGMNEKEILKVKVQVCLKDQGKNLNVVKLLKNFLNFSLTKFCKLILKKKKE
jgi:RNA recognition motif-containing protein